MVADRISLIEAYRALLAIEENDGKIDSILLNRKNEYGIKTVPRFDSLKEFKGFIDEMYPFSFASECDCLTNNEGIYNLLNVSFKIKTETIFVNNITGTFVTDKPDKINSFILKKLNEINDTIIKLERLYKEYVCFPYIEVGYISCDYIEIVRNDKYHELIELYKKSKLT